MNAIPGPRILPIFGTSLALVGLSQGERFKRSHEILSSSDIGMTRFWLGTIPLVVLTRADTVEHILSSPTILEKGALYYLMHDLLGKDSVLCSGGEHWHKRRKLLTPTFHFSILETFFPIMVDQTRVLLNKLQERACDPTDIGLLLSNCTLDIIAQTAMGVDIGAQSSDNCEYVEALRELDNFVMIRSSRIWLLNNFIFSCTKMYKKYKQYLNVVNSKSFGVIKERKENLRREAEAGYIEDLGDQDGVPKKRKAFLDLLLETHALSDEELKQEVNTFMAAGHETTSTTVKWCLFLLANNQDIQAKVHEELDDILQTNDGNVTKDEIRQMKYLECVVKESMRIYPSVELVGRSLTQDLTIKGHTIPSGTIVVINIWQLHRDEKYFPDAEVFDPDRFLPDHAVGRHPYAYTPFSAGPRNCIGQKFGMLETKVLLSMILKRFSVTSLLKTEDIHFTRNVTLKSEETIFLKFNPRA